MTDNSHIVRMEDERRELNLRAVRLSDFVHSGKVFAGLPPLKRSLLLAQLDAMNVYLKILSMRLSIEQEAPGAETSADVASIAGELLNLEAADLVALDCGSGNLATDELLGKIKTVAASALGQRQ